MIQLNPQYEEIFAARNNQIKVVKNQQEFTFVTMAQLIDELLEYFNAHVDELLKKYDGKIVVISENREITPFDDFKSGYDFGLKQYGYGKFLLKECSMPAINAVHVINPIIAVV